MPLLIIPVVLLVLAVGVVVLRTTLGDGAPSWLRGTTIVLGGAFVFFMLSGLAVLLLIVGAFSANPTLLGAAAVSMVLAVALPLAAWLIARPGLRRQRAQEAERWAVMVAQYEAERARRAEYYEAQRAQRAAYYEQVRQERLRQLFESGGAASQSRYEDVPDGSVLDGHAKPVYYEILAIDVDASGDEVERAFRREMREHHPDRGGESRRAQLINEAYDTLRDPRKRQAYDRENGLR